MKLLVVEDEKYAREALVCQIRKYDCEGVFEILQASNGEEGEHLFSLYHPELVMTDIRMPKMDGLELLKKVREMSPDTRVIILSAYSDFEYARKSLTYGATDYLLKPIDDDVLGECLDRFLKQRRSEKKDALLSGKDMVTRFILNSIRQKQEIGFVEQSMFSRVFPEYQAGLLYFSGRKPDQGMFLAQMETIYGNAFWTQFRFLELDGGLWLLVVNPGNDSVFFWRRIRKFLEEKSYGVCIGVSQIHSAASEVNAAYKEAYDAVENRIYRNDSLIFASALAAETYTDYFMSPRHEREIREALDAGNSRRAEKILEEIFAKIRGLGKVKTECLEILYSQVKLLCRRSIRVEEAQEKMEMLPGSLLPFDSLEDMKEYLCRAVREICRMKSITAQNEKGQPPMGVQSSSEIVERMEEYAKKYYHTDITVRELAENVLFMNQNYVSHLFAERKGISFSAFLRQVRIEHARELLRNAEYSVTDVAMMVGYNDTSQFIRIFKQETGMTPKKYRSYIEQGGETIEGRTSENTGKLD